MLQNCQQWRLAIQAERYIYQHLSLGLIKNSGMLLLLSPTFMLRYPFQVPKVEAAPSLEDRLAQELAPVLKHLNQAALNESTIEMLLVDIGRPLAITCFDPTYPNWLTVENKLIIHNNI